jgi:hypothetical protein
MPTVTIHAEERPDATDAWLRLEATMHPSGGLKASANCRRSLNPFNVWNGISIIVILAPGVGLIKLGERICERRAGLEK